MRQKDREVKDPEQLLEILKKCDVCRLALLDGEYPYIVPMNFGFEAEEGQTALYFHCAAEGKKLDLIKRNNRAAFEADRTIRLVAGRNACRYSMDYESVTGSGTIEIVPEAEKIKGLTALMRHYSSDGNSISRRGRCGS
jgi:nitroimidazol reductase NimA-like FMN-containing flavoprotein (pyridoxamine 5'-phosphate oxidase superfamily)